MNPDELIVGKKYLFVPYNELLIYTGEYDVFTKKLYRFENEINCHNLTKNTILAFIIHYTKLHEAIVLLKSP